MRMFKILVIAVLALFIMPNTNFAQDGSGSSQDPGFHGNGQATYIKIKFGRPKFDCKKGFGICSIEFSIRDIFELIGIIRQVLSVGGSGSGGINDDGNLQVDIYAESMDEETKDLYFHDGIFTLNESFDLPPEALEYLGISDYHIEAGNYNYEEVTIELEEETFQAYRVVF